MSGQKPTEYGGSPQRNTLQPPTAPDGQAGHSPTPSESQRLQYITGQTADTTRAPDDGEAFSGIDPLDVAIEKRRSQGVEVK